MPSPETIGTVNRKHLLLIGAGLGLGMGITRRFAVGGYHITLLARSADGLRNLEPACLTPAPRSTRSRRTQAIPRACVRID